MKVCYRFVFQFMLLGLTGAFLSSCGDPQDQALQSLKERGYENTPEDFIAAASTGDLDSLRLFHEIGTQVDARDEQGNTALIQSAMNGRQQVVETLLGWGADPTLTNEAGRGGLLAASAKGYDEVARLLIERGSDPNAEDEEGWIPLSIAAYNGHASVVELLSGESSQEQLNDSLLLASFSGDPAVIRYLLGQGAYINCRSPKGQTPLMIAAENGNNEAVRTLLQNQANPYALNEDGKTAAFLADTAGFSDVKDLILDPGLWGESDDSREIKAEMDEASTALASTEATEEVIEETVPLSVDFEEAVPDSGTDLQLGLASTQENPAPAVNPSSETGYVGTTSTSANRYPAVASAQRQSAREALVAAAKEKPMVPLNGARIATRSPKQAPMESFVLAGYREQPLPLKVEEVSGNTAQLSTLSNNRGEERVRVSQGDIIPGTNYKVEEVTKKMVSSKEGKGEMVDVSRVRVQNTNTGASHLLVKDISGYSADSYAVLTSAGSDYRYVVKTGDVFRTNQPGVGEKDYQVLDIRPNGVVIKDLDSEKVSTISRTGVIE